MGGFGGQKVSPNDLLPFRHEADDAARNIPKRTIGVLVSLIESGKLPPRVEGAARTNPDVMRALEVDA